MSPEKMSLTPEEMGAKPEQQDDKAYREHAESNGFEIDVYWDNGYKDYVIHFPQIDLTHAHKQEKGVSDELLILSRKPEVAKQIFDFAAKKAGEVKNVYDLYREVKGFTKKFHLDDED